VRRSSPLSAFNDCYATRTRPPYETLLFRCEFDALDGRSPLRVSDLALDSEQARNVALDRVAEADFERA
jgi:hypothetical protein